ncbi:MAG: glycosyltransferase family 2 protein [Ignavibacteriota bacterium]|uniref:glycosyltransferase family 2 protein n=1 Tax=Ignavibacterium album TaxID=591197 RepID=UPI0015999619|nr:glycosyltransferase family 2 protein [Ignavibacteriales bacterium]QKJ97591.1 MAG: glycosyltransferase family 2 protein [Ignavibacteriota bacterium]GIK62073.1 MAG: beta 1,4 glucosyltransferase [Ignavibacteriota bacterium]
MAELTTIILTHNEKLHLERCLRSLVKVSDKICIVDSYSNDETLKIADSYGAEVKQNKWINYAKQFNWGLENFNIDTKWVMRFDADEFLTKELAKEIKEKLPKFEKDITGIVLKRRVYFMNRWIKHGGYYPTNLLRIWRNGKGICEERWMDEHIKITEGKTITFDNDFIDDNLNNLTWWTTKHNNYATREAIDLLNIKYKFLKSESINAELSQQQDKRKRWVKENFYTYIPLFLRPFLYFIYRYIFRLGFLDGKAGLIWHFLQGFWYRFLVDAKIYDIERRAKKENKSIPEVIRENYGIEV